ncbi:MAG: sialidase family protein [Promethearchaeota archaeon]
MKSIFGAELIPNIEKFAHCSSIIELPNGNLMVSSYAGSGEHNPDTKIYTIEYDKNLRTWKKPEIRVNTPNKSDGNAVLFIDKNNRIWLFNNTIHKEWKTARFHWDWAVTDNKYMFSDDLGKTWSENKAMFPDKIGWNYKNKAIYIDNGAILIPMYDEPKWQSRIAISYDNGKSWTYSEPIITLQEAIEDFKVPKRSKVIGNLQPTLFQKSNGDILAYLRPKKLKRVLYSISKDRGKTWTYTRPTNLRNPNSGIDVVKLDSGNIFFVFNDLVFLRYKLNVALSEDEGKTWKYKKTIEKDAPWREFSYPAVIQDSRGFIHITYTFKRKYIKHLILNEEWIKS